jgi:hypothetical protein
VYLTVRYVNAGTEFLSLPEGGLSPGSNTFASNLLRAWKDTFSSTMTDITRPDRVKKGFNGISRHRELTSDNVADFARLHLGRHYPDVTFLVETRSDDHEDFRHFVFGPEATQALRQEILVHTLRAITQHIDETMFSELMEIINKV